MAFASSSSALSDVISLTTFLLGTKNLSRAYHQSWKAQILSVLRGAQLADWLDSNVEPLTKYFAKKKPDDKDEPPVVNPEYAIWIAKDQTVLSYILTNLSKEILGHMNTEVTTKGAWAAIEAMFASQSRAKWPSPRHPRVHLRSASTSS
jgi:hypothetical protein